MAAFNFPASPALNATYTLNGVTYQWNGQAWIGLAQADAPSDGFSYVRKNGIWVKDPLQFIASYSLATKLLQDIPLPLSSGYKLFRFQLKGVRMSVASANYLWCFYSADGITFNKTDTAYNWRYVASIAASGNAASATSGAGSAMGVLCSPGVMPATAGLGLSGTMELDAGVGANTMAHMRWHNSLLVATTGIFDQTGAGYVGITGANWHTIRFQVGITTGELFADGTIDLYGVL